MRSRTFNSRRSVGIRFELGASMVEYALLLVLIAMIAFAAVQYAGDELSTTYSNIAGEVQDASSN